MGLINMVGKYHFGVGVGAFMKLFAGVMAQFSLMASVSTFAKDFPFSGKWDSIGRDDDHGRPYSTFSISLNEDEVGKVRGAYCLITHYGNRIDCGSDQELNVSGRAERGKGIAIVNFYSFFGATGGVAKITVDDKRLMWDVIKCPEGGDYYSPLHIEMRKEASSDAILK
ncbi:MAG TPA: hypothetical protein VJQ54_06930 [Candidatus Sulfotelmatobacter sp.]|nr:hypothetical protein [Candidatus Sulfotelmatobacter sp.]